MTTLLDHLAEVERAMARNTDPETSHQAARRVLSTKANDQALVLRILADVTDATDFEIAQIAGRQQTSLGKRRGELRDAGLVEFAGFTRPSPSGSPARVWKITPAGIEAAS